MEAPVGDTNTLKQINGMAKPTKTTNPLHFEDLEAHRFEDLGMDVLKRCINGNALTQLEQWVQTMV